MIMCVRVQNWWVFHIYTHIMDTHMHVATEDFHSRAPLASTSRLRRIDSFFVSYQSFTLAPGTSMPL
jgi:hypothetical protein